MQETQGSTVNPILTGPGIDQRYARNDTGGRTYFLTDQLGSTAYTNPYQYTGREKDLNGLYYYRARYYRPQWARFISSTVLQIIV
ncbi:RHS repeat-associated core domain-containing protein, partial [Xanthomonas oryzae]|uniref:RHS repeat-associated core domain-containing protein n=1 Tax=Xanthomonas oryzae TaxID=347 RepID=UPI003CCE853D